MRKLWLVSVVFSVCVFVLSGCAQVSEWFNANREDIEEATTVFIVDRVTKKVDAKIDKMVSEGKITEAYAEELKLECRGKLIDTMSNIYHIIERYKDKKAEK